MLGSQSVVRLKFLCRKYGFSVEAARRNRVPGSDFQAAGSAGRSAVARRPDRNGRLIGHGARSPQHLHTVEAQRSCLLIPASPDVPCWEETRCPGHTLAEAHHYRLRPIATFRAESTTHTKPNWPPEPWPAWSSSLGQLPKENPTEADRQKSSAGVAVKEQHAEIVKHEIQVIWSDYFKPEHLERYRTSTIEPGRSSSSPARISQNIDAQGRRRAGSRGQGVRDIFWSTKK